MAGLGRVPSRQKGQKYKNKRKKSPATEENEVLKCVLIWKFYLWQQKNVREVQMWMLILRVDFTGGSDQRADSSSGNQAVKQADCHSEAFKYRKLLQSGFLRTA